MWFRKKRDEERRQEAEKGDKSYNDVISSRLSSIGGYIHNYDENERDEVEARLRRMFYGAKVEGGLADRATDARETVLDGSDDTDGHRDRAANA